MSQSVPALIKPALLIWGRERAGLRLPEAALRSELNEADLIAWESGVGQPSIAQLRKLAAVYRRPIAVFFLPEPPKGFDAQREFRRLPGLEPQGESVAFRRALQTAIYRREAARNIYEQLGDEIPTLDAAIQPFDNAETVSAIVRELLGISWAEQLSWSGPYAAWDAWRSAIERHGILVFQASRVALQEMRGISIPEGPLPVILINNADAPHGRVFSLLHEFVHLLLANGGARTSKLEGEKLPEDQLLERVSNRFAAAILMPEKEFIREATNFPHAMIGENEGLNGLAKRIKVSPEAILRRLVSLNKTRASIYRERRRVWQTQPVPAKSAGGPPVEVKALSMMGRTFASLVLHAYQRNAVSSAEAVEFLGVQFKYIQKVAEQLLVKPGGEAAH